MRHLPKNEYNSITIILSNPSRFDIDNKELLSGNAGWWFWNVTAFKGISRYRCDIRTVDTMSSGLLPETKRVLCLGERAMHEMFPNYREYSLNEQRGIYLNSDPKTICSYLVQDAFDIVDHEHRLNPLLNSEGVDEDEDDEHESEETTKRKGATRRSNYRFWLYRDIQRLLSDAVPGSEKNHVPSVTHNYHIYSSPDEIIEALTNENTSDLCLDLETVIGTYQIRCFSFGSSEVSSIYCVPILRYDWSLAYSERDTVRIIRALVWALNRKLIICHNAMFDLLILAWKYKLVFGRRVYDTMLAHHRCWPEAEKSLGHAMSHLTHEPYHKDEGLFMPRNSSQDMKLLEYNGKDVRGTLLVKWAIDRLAAKDPGLSASIAQANSMIRPCIINTLHGMTYDKEKLEQTLRENDISMTWYLRAIKYLIGEVGYKLAAGKSSSALPLSNSQMVKYFHDQLNYPVQKVSKKTGKASLDAKSIYQLKLAQPDNAVMDFVLAYRMKSKESGSLKFTDMETMI